MNQINQSDVELNVNNQQAKRSLGEVRAELKKLQEAWLATAQSGDKAMRDKIQKQINACNRELRQMESGAKSVERVMGQLNKATPSELNKALKFLNQELKTIERGTPAWDAHVQKIRQVKAEIDKVNAELKQSESLMTRMKNRINEWGATAATAAAALTGVVAAGKAAVTAYAEMQQEEANVRKYTGMTEEQVTHLNEAFKKMDTRSSREQLNQLAQEAGRLGMQSEEDVLGFVRAADKINVSLDDLGDGATLILSKLTDIFGDKQALGTERSLLAVGSVINELSQNSTAAAPYLAEFAQRLAGVGAQAHMTIPEIMGFGAVLDSQGQKLEMSSTALSKVIMNLFKDPEKIAKATGLAVEEFSETCKRSTNEGLLMLLDRLHELGGIDSLAPVFADMGENGARASAVLAALAGNVDMVRQQQEAANVAFQEAVSIDKEFTVQNTTVQAELEKRKKIFQEHAVELGQKLLPVMGYFHSSMSYTMKALSATIDFVKKYRTEMLAAAAAVATYYAIVKAKEAWETFVSGCNKAITAVKAFNKALLSNPYAAIAALVVGIGLALYGFIQRSREAVRAADEHRKALERQQEAEKKTASAVGEVVSKYQLMKQEWERLTTAQQKREWLEKNRDAFEQLGLNITNAVDADEAFIKSSDKVIEALKARAKANALQDLYQEKMKQVYEDAASQEDTMRRRSAGDTVGYKTDEWKAFQASGRSTEGMFKQESRMNPYTGDISEFTVFTEEGAEIFNNFLDQLHQQGIEEAVKIGSESVEQMFGSMYSSAQKEAAAAERATGGLMGDKPSGTVTGGTTPVTGGTQVDPEKELKEQLQRLADIRKTIMAQDKIAYLSGQTDFETYQKAQLETEIAYQKKVMEVHGKGTTGYLEAEAAKLEAEKKLQDQQTGLTVEAEQKRYADVKAVLDQRYADSELSAKAYQLATEQAELEHLRNLANTYEKGSKERLKAEERYQQRSTAIQQKHAADAKRIQEQLQKEYFSNVGMTTNTESYKEEKLQLEAVRQIMLAQATADQELQIEEAYQKAKYELAKKYNDEAGMMAVDAAQASVDKVLEYLKSDAFQAFYQSFQTLVSGMGEIFSGLSDLIDAEVTLQEQKINKKYDAELAAAGRNEYAIAQIEKKKEEEIAAIKNEAEEKKYGMQIASTIAQTAIAAVNAYSSAAAIPMVGWIIAPFAAAMAVAAGGIQLMTLKKEHEAAMSQGYAAGGYTMPGKKYQPAGIVHAGEWVASQELLANPTAAATIAQLDEAQRTNTIGQLDRQQVSASVSAPVAVAQTPRPEPASDNGLNGTIQKLNKRLDEPFVTNNTVTGDRGTLRAQRKYEQLMRNKNKK